MPTSITTTITMTTTIITHPKKQLSVANFLEKEKLFDQEHPVWGHEQTRYNSYIFKVRDKIAWNSKSDEKTFVRRLEIGLRINIARFSPNKVHYLKALGNSSMKYFKKWNILKKLFIEDRYPTSVTNELWGFIFNITEKLA